MQNLIAVVDDDKSVLNVVTAHLEKAEYNPKGFSDAKGLFKFLERQKPDLIILDVGLPDMDGFEVCKRLKMDNRTSSIPIIMLTGKGEETYKVLGLEMGADDYVVKPYSVKELVARVKVILRRHGGEGLPKDIRIGKNIEINTEEYEVKLDGKKIELTPAEFKILALLSAHKGHVLSREKILEHLWEGEKIVVDRTIDVHIRHLREKLGKASKFVKNVRGVGYKIEE